jgi:hypothetical protein
MGGQCAFGQCQPIPLATAQTYPRSIVAYNGAVYWIDQGFDPGITGKRATLMSIQSDGTNLRTVSTHYSLDALSNDATTLYFSGTDNDGYGEKIYKVLMTGGTVTTLVQSRGAIFGITNDSTYVYWTEVNGGLVARALKVDGSGLSNLATGQMSPLAIANIAVGTPHVFWGDLGDRSTGTNGSLWSSSPTGVGAMQLAATPSSSVSAVINDEFGNVYYGAAGIWRVHDDGTGNTQLSPPNGSVGQSMAIDDANVYWPEGTTAIGFVGQNGSHPSRLGLDILVQNLSGVQAVAVDSTYVYFTTAGSANNSYADGAVYKIAK